MKRRDREDAFERVVAANAADVLRYLGRRTPGAEEAADAFAASVEIAWRKAAQLPDDPERARMWLFAIARNVLLHLGRSRTRARAATEKLAGLLARDVAVDRGDATDLALDVRGAVAALPSDLAELVRLVHWDGFTLAAAAELTGVPAGTARSRYARARALLTAALAEGYGASREGERASGGREAVGGVN